MITYDPDGGIGYVQRREWKAGSIRGWIFGFEWITINPQKNGRVPGILWTAPTYVTELVGYQFRREGRAFVMRLG